MVRRKHLVSMTRLLITLCRDIEVDPAPTGVLSTVNIRPRFDRRVLILAALDNFSTKLPTFQSHEGMATRGAVSAELS